MATATATDLWATWADGAWAVIPTNTQVRGDGTAVMGAGLAADAAQRFPDLARRYGTSLRRSETNLAVNTARLLLVPTKTHWRNPSTVEHLNEAIAAICRWWTRHPEVDLAVPALGCGLGGLDWEPVETALRAAFDPYPATAYLHPPR